MNNAAVEPSFLRCHDLQIGYPGRPLLPTFDWEIKAGELVLLLGPNGAGKTTFLKTILRLLPPQAGRLEFAPALRLAYVPQETSLDPVLPIRGLDVARWGTLRNWNFLVPYTSKSSCDRADAALHEVQAKTFDQKSFRQLSGGQRQRILFARMLATDADFALLDEPTAAMDVEGQRTVLELLRKLAKAHNKAMLVTTHNLAMALKYADRVLFLLPPGETRQAAIIQGSPEELAANPQFQELTAMAGFNVC